MREDIVYLYINSFAYKQAKHGKSMGGHPLPGRIYRALYDKETSLYRILLDTATPDGMSGIILKDLSGDSDRWVSDIVQINDDNILTLDVDPEDFNKLAKWREDDNDISRLRLENINEIQNKNGIVSVSVPNEPGDTTESDPDEISDLINHIKEADPVLYEGLTKALKGISMFLSIKPNHPDLSRIAGLNPIIGKGVNIGIATDSIDEYILSDHPMAAGCISKAVYYLLTEIARINKD